MSFPPEFAVEFKGGPWGGEKKYMSLRDWPAGELRVPTYIPSQGMVCYSENATLPPPTVNYFTETYRLDRASLQWSKSNSPWYSATYTANWVNPNTSLQRENAKLKQELEAVRKLAAWLDMTKQLIKEAG